MVGRRRGSGLPATALAGGGAVRWDFLFPPRDSGLLSNVTDASWEVMARRGWRWCKTCGRRRAGSPPIGRPAGARQGRPMPGWTAGRWGTGLPQARGLLRPLVTGGGGRRTGSLQNGRPAGHRQGCPFLPGFPIGPNTFWMLRRGATSPVGCSRGLQLERRSERRAAGIWYRAGGGDSEVALRSRAPWGVQ